MTKCPHFYFDDFLSGASPGPSDSEYVRKFVVFSKICGQKKTKTIWEIWCFRKKLAFSSK